MNQPVEPSKNGRDAPVTITMDDVKAVMEMNPLFGVQLENAALRRMLEEQRSSSVVQEKADASEESPAAKSRRVGVESQAGGEL